ncbi:protein PIN-LIKES 3-like [Phoenix dactylifera]|uniref:Protein PIN-LIKES 3-like n=1 Tax=Phoenix dactylifera TaxID=42345 RepID=A0A8B9AL41_PHODC|nr:protein PIN-LIKES 3-like [Phoenix dactylifera]
MSKPLLHIPLLNSVSLDDMPASSKTNRITLSIYIYIYIYIFVFACSNGTIPSLILITGGNLTKGLHGPGVKSTLILGVAVVRYIALPLFGAAIVKGAIHLGLVHPDPLYQFILLLQHAVPPAMNIASMIQMFEAGEGELSVIFLWTYAVASVALTLWLTLFLWLVS